MVYGTVEGTDVGSVAIESRKVFHNPIPFRRKAVYKDE